MMERLEIDQALLLGELRNTLIFQNLSNEELTELAAICEVAQYADGEVIVRQDSLSPYLYIILDGKVDIALAGAEKKNIVISRVAAGDVFGEASIFLDVHRTATVIADGIVSIIVLSRDKLIDFANRLPKAGLKIFTFIIYSLLNKLSASNKELAFEKESSVTMEDIEELKKFFPTAALEDIIPPGA
jgi:CRP-like cAMP-binding protein